MVSVADTSTLTQNNLLIYMLFISFMPVNVIFQKS